MIETNHRGESGLRALDTLAAAERTEMYSLLARHFEGVTQEGFERDLMEKNWVVEIRHEQRLVGFSTLLVEEALFDGRALTVVYSGDTIMSPEAWGKPALARTWITAVNTLRAATPSRLCYWLLLTSGYRTYRFLPVFWREFYPRHDIQAPCDQQQLLHELARKRYGDCYDSAEGIVRFPHPQKLRDSLAHVSAGRAQNAHVAYFLTQNPGHAAGDELVCLTQISDTNLTPAGRRIVTASAA